MGSRDRHGPHVEALLACSLLLLSACACGCVRERDDLARATAAVEPHLERFARFDRWARRASAGRQVMSDEEALGETIFARVRNDRDVLAAWVARGGSRGRTYALPEAAVVPEGQRWVALRTELVGPVRVASPQRCPLDLPRWWRGELAANPCVLVQREDGTLTVTMAFGPPKTDE